jgi:sugar/nucleoside kinase (ribokinase family)
MIPKCDCLCVGLAVADHVCIPIQRMPAAGELVVCDRLEMSIGGCAANVAADLGKLGVDVAIVARIGQDLFGRFVREQLAAAGVQTAQLRETPGRDTSGTLVVNVRGEDRRFIHAFGANADFDGSEVTPEAIRGTRVLYLGGYFAMPQLRPAAVAQLFQQARAAGVQTVLDVVIPRPGEYWDDLAAVLPWTDVFLPNSDEGLLMTGCADPVAQARRFHAAGARTAVVTCGSAGAVVIGEHESFRAGAFQVDFVDGTGSGDAFDAGYIYGLLHGRSPRECVTLGSALGASCVRKSGSIAGVFTRPELDAFLETRQLVFEPL